MKICKLLFIYRNIHKITVRELGQIIGVSGSTISRIENGETCDGKTLALILRWLLEEE